MNSKSVAQVVAGIGVVVMLLVAGFAQGGNPGGNEPVSDNEENGIEMYQGSV